MNTTKLALLPFLALVSQSAACVDDYVGEGEEAEVAETTAAVTNCTPQISAAAITKQIVSVDEPVDLSVEILTISPKPFKMQATALTYPYGFGPKSMNPPSCIDLGDRWKCRNLTTITANYATTGTGAYSMSFTGIADEGSGCANGGALKVDFGLVTESFTQTEVDMIDYQMVIFPGSSYSGFAYGLTEGSYSFTKNLAGLNDAIGSIKIAPGYFVTLYDGPDFNGQNVTYSGMVPNLGVMIHRASSMRVFRAL